MRPAPTVAAVIPIKAFRRGKSRLAPDVHDDARAALAERMFTHVLRLSMQVFDLTVVVTRGEAVARAARALGAQVVADPEDAKGLADVVDAGLRAVADLGARSGVVLMADLPRIGAVDLQGLRARIAEAEVVIVPDHKGRHTNALALTPPTRFATRFGHPESLAEHRRLAGPDGTLFRNHALSLDVDLVADLSHLPPDLWSADADGSQLDEREGSAMRTTERR